MSKFSMQLITYWEGAAAGNGSPSRCNLTDIPLRRSPRPWAAHWLWREVPGDLHSSKRGGSLAQTALGCQVSSMPQSPEWAGCSSQSPHWWMWLQLGLLLGEHTTTALTFFVCRGCGSYMYMYVYVYICLFVCMSVCVCIREGVVAARATPQLLLSGDTSIA